MNMITRAWKNNKSKLKFERIKSLSIF